MRKLISFAVISSVVSVFALPAFAQSTPAPTGPSDCKPNEMWDAAKKVCKPK